MIMVKCICGHNFGMHHFTDYVSFKMECSKGKYTPDACKCQDFQRKTPPNTTEFKVNDWVSFSGFSGLIESVGSKYALVKVNGKRPLQKVAVSKLQRFA